MTEVPPSPQHLLSCQYHSTFTATRLTSVCIWIKLIAQFCFVRLSVSPVFSGTSTATSVMASQPLLLPLLSLATSEPFHLLSTRGFTRLFLVQMSRQNSFVSQTKTKKNTYSRQILFRSKSACLFQTLQELKNAIHCHF